MSDVPGIEEIHKAASFDDFKASGILFVVCIGLGIALIYIFKRLEKLYAERSEEQKENLKKIIEFSEIIVKINSQYTDNIKILSELFAKKR